MELKKATRKAIPLKIGISGPSGSGKTYSSLLLARGLATGWEKIAVIDSENGSADLYSHLGEYNTLTLEAPYTPERYIEAIEQCEKSGMEVIIIDSTSHWWEAKGGLLESNEKVAQAKFKGNTWSAWSQTTPRYQAAIEKIVSSKSHIICTVRAKTETIMTEDKKIKKVGMKDVQREGFEYEFTVFFNLDRDNYLATASKDRTSLFSNMDPFLINEGTGKTLLDWSNSGYKEPKATPEQYVLIKSLISKTKSDDKKMKEFLRVKDYDELTEKKAGEFIKILQDRELEIAKNENKKEVPEDPNMTLKLDEVDLDEVAKGIEENEKNINN